MSKANIIVAIIGLLGVITASIITAKCTKTQPTSVISGGNKNTIINSESGVVSLNQGISKQDIIDALESTVTNLRNEKSKEMEIERLKERLSKIHASSLGSIPEEADKWAESFISSLPIRRDKVNEQQVIRKKRDDFINTNIPYLFEYMISFVDKRIIALKSHLPGIEITGTDLDNYFINKDSSSSIELKNVCVREVKFLNGNGFKVNVELGIIEKGYVVKRPRFSWHEVNCIKDCSQFRLWGECYAGISPPPCYLSFISDDPELQLDRLNSTLTSAFDRLIENILLTE